MNNEKIDVQKFCKTPQIDIQNIYLGPQTSIKYCSCPPPPKYIESEPLDEEYLNDSRYVSEKDRIKYMEEYNLMIKEQQYLNDYDYQPIEILENNFLSEHFEEEHISEMSDDDYEDEYVDDEGEFELVRK